MKTFVVMGEKPSIRPGQKLVMRIETPTFSEAHERCRAMVADGWRITQTPEPIGFPSFPLESAA